MDLFKSLLDKKFWKTTLAFALPISIQNLLMSSFAIVDNIMVGKLESSEEALSAVAMAGQVAFVMNIFLFGICSGGLVFAAQYWGNKNIKGIKNVYGLVMSACLGVGILFCAIAFFASEFIISFFTNNPVIMDFGIQYLKIACFSYIGIAINMGASAILRSTEKVKLPMITSLISVLSNVVLNYALIFGKLGLPEMGIKGAALATVIASVINPLALYIISFFQKNILISRLGEMFSFTKEIALKIFKRSSPVIFNEFVWAIGIVLFNVLYGHMEPDGNYTAFSISKNIENIVFVFFVGICNACAVLIGKYIGEGNIKKAKAYSKRYMVLYPIMGLILGALVIVLKDYILLIYDQSDYVIKTAGWLLVIYGLEITLRNIPYICIVGIFRAGGDTTTGVKYDLCCLWLISLPVSYLCAYFFKLPFLAVYAISLFIEDIPKTILCIRHYISMKWLMPVDGESLMIED